MPRKPPDRPNPYFTFLRRLRAGGRSNMYGAIPYLIAAFGCNRDDAFRIVCEWLDTQVEPAVSEAPREPAQPIAVPADTERPAAPHPARPKPRRSARRNGRKASRRKAA
jgi:hypothetical protein